MAANDILKETRNDSLEENEGKFYHLVKLDVLSNHNDK